MQTNNCTFHMESGCRVSNAKKVSATSGGRKCSGERCSLARDISDAPTAILSSGMVSCSSSVFNIPTFQSPYMLVSAELISSALERV